MQQIQVNDGGRFLPDRYVEGDCPNCNAPGARVINVMNVESHMKLMVTKPKSKMNPDAKIEIRDTEHLFYRLDLSKTLKTGIKSV